MPETPSVEDLQQRWNSLYRTTLPQLAKCKDPVQRHWPVQLDHCFARIILDNAVGITKPWTDAVKSPAWKNMTRDQLLDALELGESIATGGTSLRELDERSLELRGKASKTGTKRKQTYTEDGGDGGPERSPKVRRKNDRSISTYFQDSNAMATKNPRTFRETIVGEGPIPSTHPAKLEDRTTDLNSSPDPLELITTSKLTPFRKTVLTLLCHVPKGRYTTYAAMSDHISATSHKTCGRAVGSAMRNNPFAPVVPCHRVLAHDGHIGGFGGHWGAEGKYAKEKMDMLRAEGVRFDGKGKAVGEVFRGFGG